MNLVVDYGNSLAKVGIFDHHAMINQRIFTTADELKFFLQNFSADNFIISSVNHDASTILQWVSHIKHKFILTATLPLPIENRYGTPTTLGVDRIAGVCGAQQKFPGEHCLVIDAGTCVTYDFIDNKKNFLGGGISPGLKMRFKAVNTFTARLPLINPADNPDLIGSTTETCIQSGVVLGMVEEIQGIIVRYQQKFEGLRVFLCGGDARFFENKLKGPIFAIPELVLSGLNSILIYNVGG
jgi:type III pantothenate kinase